MCIAYIGNILYDKKLLDDNRCLIIFGCGLYGKKVAKYLEEKGMRNNILCFCDANKGVTEEEVMGIPVWEPSRVCEHYPQADYLISGKYSGEMYKFLIKNHIGKIHILVF